MRNTVTVFDSKTHSECHEEVPSGLFAFSQYMMGSKASRLTNTIIGWCHSVAVERGCKIFFQCQKGSLHNFYYAKKSMQNEIKNDCTKRTFNTNTTVRSKVVINVAKRWIKQRRSNDVFMFDKKVCHVRQLQLFYLKLHELIFLLIGDTFPSTFDRFGCNNFSIFFII